MISSSFYILLLFWFIHIIHRVFYSVYFWQLKEYRLDRIISETKKSIKVLLPKTSFIAILVLAFFVFFVEAEDKSIWNNLVMFAAYAFGSYSLFLLFKKSWKFPKFTSKTIVLSFLIFLIVLSCTQIFFNQFLMFAVITEIVIGAVIFSIVQFVQLPTNLIKNIIYKKAKDKIAKFKNLTVIGITGSYGKSSTKEFLYAILSSKYSVLKTKGNINTEIGVAKTVLKELKPYHNIFIVEMGAYRKGEISLLCDIVKPKFGVVTGVNEQHISLFGSWENLLSAEGGRELAKALPSDGKLFVNGNNKYCLDLIKRIDGIQEENKKIYSLNNKLIDADIWSDSITTNKGGVSFLAIDKTGDLAHFDLNVLGRHNVQNFLGAVLVAKEFGINLHQSSEACKNINPKLAGLVLKEGIHGINIIDSSYSANPDGVSADLDYLSVFKRKKIIVMPCLIELGEYAEKIHERLGKKIGQICDLVIITNDDYFKALEKGFNQTKKSTAKITLMSNIDDIYSVITTFCKSEDAVLFEGRVPTKLINMFL